MWGIIGTWEMALQGIKKSSSLLENGNTADIAIIEAIKDVEDNPNFTSVGYGGLPNENGEVELDAAFMDGNNLSFGAVAGIKNFNNPITIAKALSKDRFNIFLVGKGAESYAEKNGFEKKNMLTLKSKEAWEKRIKDIKEKNLSPYDGHDTVGMVCLDKYGNITAGTSTSGLFMKKEGRVGDSPMPGSGLYVDSKIGGATATGLGEDIMKGCISYEAVRLMEEGYTPQEAVNIITEKFNKKLIDRRGTAGAFSIVCMNKEGKWGVGTNVEFPFVVSTELEGTKVYVANFKDNKIVYKPLI
ncbi:N(4)-(beta-N-acetylglucosaminyl)-L-asparaginase [Haloimpatiens lingqiaonensis]|uniref:N(4)-(beta-N-acetylglucosaminyl)-L-asparaginase n=1 Tax=Haloimpatiens lingqiaonensis TaxID=1380675 RepID=UPI0010FE2685|nr:N(4)-(beta-N-acetylglucosaminyl)-L-asparaginase [Haloimpatiens lingqiaonensis]